MDKLKPARKPYHSLISFVKDRPGHDWRYAVNISKIKSQLGFYPKITFETGLMNTIKFHINLAESYTKNEGFYIEELR